MDFGLCRATVATLCCAKGFALPLRPAPFVFKHGLDIRPCAILGVKQPEVSRLKSGKFSYYSVERLMRFLDRLGCEVSIHIVGPEQEETERVMMI